MVDASPYVFEIRRGGHVVDYMANSDAESLWYSNFPQSFENNSLTFAGVQERSVIANIPKPRYDRRHIGCYAIELGIESGA